MASYRTTPPVPADIITYRFNGNLVFVQPARTYEAAIEESRKVFPELHDIPDAWISFYITATVGSTKAAVRVAESAWLSAVSRLLRGEIVDVRVEEPKSIAPPPQYLDVPENKESLEFYRESRSAPGSRSPSRETSPSIARSRSTERLSWLRRR